MHPTRRDFLKASGSLIALGSSIPAFLGRTALAAPMADKPGARETILVVVQLTGGNDGLNTVIPFADDDYRKLRPTLAIPKGDLRKVNDSLGLHPSLEGFSKLLEENALCIAQGVGYPNPSQSHFRSMDIWQAAATAETLSEGWLGKAMKGFKGGPSFHLKDGGESSPLAFESAPTRAPSIASLDEFQLQLAAGSSMDKQEQRAIIEGSVQSRQPDKPGLLDFVKRTANNTYASSQHLQEVAKAYQPKTPYPATGLANRLKLAAQLIDADLGSRIFYVSIDGFDTHATQANAHANLLREVSDAMTAFYRDLAARGHKDRLLLMTFSEFGRRTAENGSRGTDHGSAAPMFLVGGKVKPGVVGAHPSLTQLEDGNLKHHTDFRQVYAAVLEKWLGVDSKQVLGEQYKTADVLQT